MLEPGAAGADGLVPVPTQAHLLPPGPFRAVDGRPYDCEAWQLDATIAQRVIERLAGQKNDVLIDYEHQSLRAEFNGQKVPAAGWFKVLEWQSAGLYATSIGWTPDAQALIAKKEYRYISAVFSYYSNTGEVLEIISVALTNTPALDGLDALSARAALSRSAFSTNTTNLTKEEGENMDKDQQIAALSAKVATLEPQAAQVAALTAERDAQVAKLAALTTERDTAQAALTALTAKADQDKHAELLTAALTDGRLAPAQKAWAEKQSLVQLTEYLGATAPLVDKTRQADQKDGQGDESLTAVELATCTRMGVSPKDFLAAKKK